MRWRRSASPDAPSRDHLDYHGTIEAYFEAKARLFRELLPEGAPAVLNLDDARGAKLAREIRGSIGFTVRGAKGAALEARSIQSDLSGLRFELRGRFGEATIESPLIGAHNAENLLAALGLLLGLGVPLEQLSRATPHAQGAPGRLERVPDPGGRVVLVDYAHTDDALKNLLETARPLAAGRVITVFGCGGDRDRTKRPLMGAVAARLSDLVIVTSDNPRSEDPERIIEEIRRGIVIPANRVAPKGQHGTPSLAIVDRREAIEKGIREAKPGDLVLIAGKGHEKYQVIGDRTLPFDDVEVARAALAKRRSGSRVP
ncbi:MAG: hypothetical protein DMF84_10995 [Acidobacteria bacterium]|nr:MAG: hypothetical protein DMF84_10995 [Acidobacteriota bacterium]